MSSSSSRTVVEVRRAIHSPYIAKIAEATLRRIDPGGHGQTNLQISATIGKRAAKV
jgi:hypothetical protein